MQCTAPAIGIAMCQTVIAVAEWQDSAYGLDFPSQVAFRNGEFGVAR